ncbi:MAG: hypothetical protein JNM63_15410, partial [Spirochaetia bacterium]|nr:hypothetical protein [Spirochaetia bacterium]
ASASRGFRDEAAGDGKGGWTDQGNNDLRGMKSGALNLAGVPFNVLDPEKNGGRSVLALRPKESSAFASEAVVNVGAACDFLYLLHAAAWAGSGQQVGSLVWEYEGGEKKVVRLVSGDQVGDWWSGVAKNAFSKSFEDVNPTKSPVYLFVTSFANPAPDKSVKRVVLQCAESGNAIWLVLSATAGTGDNVVESARFAARDYSKWKPFAPGLANADKPLLDLSFLLDAPAGKHGFLQSKGGKFVFADGTPGRFMAVNIHSANGLMPSHDEAERVAKTLSRYGINLVRLHLMEGVLSDRNAADRQTPAGEDTWDRFDYLVKSLKDRGIYVELDSILGLSGRSFSEADGFEGAKDYAPHRAWAVYHPRLRELGKNWAKIVLTH